MPNPTYATTPPPFDPPDNAKPAYDAISAAQRSRLVKFHNDGKQAWSASLDDDLQERRLVMKRSGNAYLSPWGCEVAIYAHYQGVT
jgi:hypothetical protein